MNDTSTGTKHMDILKDLKETSTLLALRKKKADITSRENKILKDSQALNNRLSSHLKQTTSPCANTKSFSAPAATSLEVLSRNAASGRFSQKEQLATSTSASTCSPREPFMKGLTAAIVALLRRWTSWRCVVEQRDCSWGIVGRSNDEHGKWLMRYSMMSTMSLKRVVRCYSMTLDACWTSSLRREAWCRDILESHAATWATTIFFIWFHWVWRISW